MEISKESWDALTAGQARDNQRIMDLQVRLCRMANQIEKLSCLLEFEVGEFTRYFKDAQNIVESEEYLNDNRMAFLEEVWGKEQARRRT